MAAPFISPEMETNGNYCLQKTRTESFIETENSLLTVDRSQAVEQSIVFVCLSEHGSSDFEPLDLEAFFHHIQGIDNHFGTESGPGTTGYTTERL